MTVNVQTAPHQSSARSSVSAVVHHENSAGCRVQTAYQQRHILSPSFKFQGVAVTGSMTSRTATEIHPWLHADPFCFVFLFVYLFSAHRAVALRQAIQKPARSWNNPTHTEAGSTSAEAISGRQCIVAAATTFTCVGSNWPFAL